MQRDILGLKKWRDEAMPKLSTEVDTLAGDVTALNAFAMDINTKTKP